MALCRCTLLALVTLPLVISPASAAPPENASLVVQVSGGQLRGKLQGSYHIFRGIPYGAAPVGDLRFSPPQPHPGWSGELDASNFGPSCLAEWGWESINFTSHSEDCLTINIVAPSRSGRYPVMFFIHAGEFIIGASNDAESDFPYFAKDIVLVVPNYRIGALGYLADDVLRSRDPKGGTGNYGMLDQRLALEWVQANIEAFGGDAGNVAIAGESSGGTCVMFHLSAFGEAPSKLFHKAILESPGITQTKSWADATLNTEYMVSMLTAMGSPDCVRAPGYATFNDTGLYAHPVYVSSNDTVDSAMQWCDRNATCTGFTRDSAKNSTTFVSSHTQHFYGFHVFRHPGSTVFLQRGPSGDGRVRCLVSADARQLTDMSGSSLPRGDSVFDDTMAPTVDGVYLTETLVSKLAKGIVAHGIDILAGTNLDEGTEFLMYAPPIGCNATDTDLDAWSKAFYGSSVPELESLSKLGYKLETPLPNCCANLGYGRIGGFCKDKPGESIPGEKALPYMTAMRSSGDVAFRCPTRHVARFAHGRSYVYHFTMTPQFSENMLNTSINGAFHGSEVPFVFGYGFELRTPAEQKLSKIMGCYWRNFMWYGDPSGEDCGEGSVAWPQFNRYGSPHIELGAEVTVQNSDAGLEERCALLDQWLRLADGEYNDVSPGSDTSMKESSDPVPSGSDPAAVFV